MNYILTLSTSTEGPSRRSSTSKLTRSYRTRILRTTRIVHNNVSVIINTLSHNIVAGRSIRTITTITLSKQNHRITARTKFIDDLIRSRIDCLIRLNAICVSCIGNEVCIRTSIITITSLLCKPSKICGSRCLTGNVTKCHSHSSRTTARVCHSSICIITIRFGVTISSPTGIRLGEISTTIQRRRHNATSTLTALLSRSNTNGIRIKFTTSNCGIICINIRLIKSIDCDMLLVTDTEKILNPITNITCCIFHLVNHTRNSTAKGNIHVHEELYH